MSSSRSTGCLPREARVVCPPLPRGDMCKMITECPPREARSVLLAKHWVSARLYHAATDITVCPSHTAQCRNVSVTNRAISRGVSVTHHRSHTARYRAVSKVTRVSVTQRVTDTTRPMWCMAALYFLQHSSSASPSLSYNLINEPASYYSKQGVSCTVGNGTVS